MNLNELKIQLQELETEMQRPEILSMPEKLGSLNKEYAEITEKIELMEQLKKLNEDLDQAKEALEGDDVELKKLAQEEIDTNKKKELKIKEKIEELEPKDPLDKRDIIVEIRAAAGGDEAGLFAADLFRMYSRYAEEQDWTVTLLSSNRSGIGGFKEVIFEIKGRNVYARLKYESGVHRVQRIPETEKSGRIHTSTATVAVLPLVQHKEIEIKPEDLKIDVFRSSGPGGQSVNTTDSAVRITHVPSGLVVTCQDEKSQHKNKDKALRILQSRLFDMQQQKAQQERDSKRRGQIGTGDRSEKIRTYNFPQDRITDHRIEKSWGRIEKILDGKLDKIISSIISFQKKKAAE